MGGGFKPSGNNRLVDRLVVIVTLFTYQINTDSVSQSLLNLNYHANKAFFSFSNSGDYYFSDKKIYHFDFTEHLGRIVIILTYNCIASINF